MKKIQIYSTFDSLKSASDNTNLESFTTDQKELLELIDMLKASLKSKSSKPTNIR